MIHEMSGSTMYDLKGMEDKVHLLCSCLHLTSFYNVQASTKMNFTRFEIIHLPK